MKTQRNAVGIVAAAVLLLLSACAAPEPSPGAGPALPPPALVPAYQCSADGARFAIGQPLTPQLEAAARARAGAGAVRVMKPGDMATTELDGGRLNLDVDARNRVTDVRCG